MSLRIAIRQRLRDWPVSLAFSGIIGAAVAVAGAWLAIAYPVLLGRLPFPDADRLLAVETLKKGQRSGVTWTTMEDLRGGSVPSIAAYTPRTWGLQTEPRGHVEVVLSQQVTGEFFDVLGVAPALGEPLTPRHDQPGNQDWVWFSHSAWTRLLGSSRSALRETVWINAVPYRVAGVLPASFDLPNEGQSPDIYIPLKHEDYWTARGVGALSTIVRLKPGVTTAQFQAELEARSKVLAADYPASNRDVRFVATKLGFFLLGERLNLLRWLLAAVAILVLIAIANASGVWLAQWLKQQHHAAIKLALGASIREVFFEQSLQAMVLGAASAVVGLLGSRALLAALRASAITGPELQRFELWHPAVVDPFVGACLVVLAMAAGLGSAGLPLLAISTGALHAAGAGRTTSRSSGRTRLALAIVQLTMTGTLAYAGILIWRNVESLVEADRGFRTDQILIAGIGIPEARYNTDEKMIRFHQQAIEELRKIPGVTLAAGGVSLPVSQFRTRFLLDNDNAPRDEQNTARIGAASPELLPLLEIPLLRGRLFSTADRTGTSLVAVVNESFVQKYLSGTDPLGHRVRVAFYNGTNAKPYDEHIIVGVVGNTLNRDLALESEPQIILSSDQMAFEGFHYFLRSSLPAAALRNDVERAIWNVDPECQRVGVKPLAAHVEQSLMSRRMLAWMLALFGAVSILIVGFGLGSSLTATFLEMTREFGIRAALGASPMRLAFEATRWGSLAIALSWALSFPLCFAISRSLVLDHKPVGFDYFSYLLAGLLLSSIGLAAGLTPARRAASIDPAITLRAE